jgi:hypothetical protein
MFLLRCPWLGGVPNIVTRAGRAVTGAEDSALAARHALGVRILRSYQGTSVVKLPPQHLWDNWSEPVPFIAGRWVRADARGGDGPSVCARLAEGWFPSPFTARRRMEDTIG